MCVCIQEKGCVCERERERERVCEFVRGERDDQQSIRQSSLTSVRKEVGSETQMWHHAPLQKVQTLLTQQESQILLFFFTSSLSSSCLLSRGGAVGETQREGVENGREQRKQWVVASTWRLILSLQLSQEKQ